MNSVQTYWNPLRGDGGVEEHEQYSDLLELVKGEGGGERHEQCLKGSRPIGTR